MKQRKRTKMKTRAHYVLFNPELPFKQKVEKDRKKFKRQQKHKKNINNE